MRNVTTNIFILDNEEEYSELLNEHPDIEFVHAKSGTLYNDFNFSKAKEILTLEEFFAYLNVPNDGKKRKLRANLFLKNRFFIDPPEHEAFYFYNNDMKRKQYLKKSTKWALLVGNLDTDRVYKLDKKKDGKERLFMLKRKPATNQTLIDLGIFDFIAKQFIEAAGAGEKRNDEHEFTELED